MQPDDAQAVTPRRRWVATIPPDQAGEPLKKALDALEAMYPPEYGQPIDAFCATERSADGGGIVPSRSLHPDERLGRRSATRIGTSREAIARVL